MRRIIRCLNRDEPGLFPSFLILTTIERLLYRAPYCSFLLRLAILVVKLSLVSVVNPPLANEGLAFRKVVCPQTGHLSD